MGYAPDFVLYGIGPYLADIKRKGEKIFVIESIIIVNKLQAQY